MAKKASKTKKAGGKKKATRSLSAKNGGPVKGGRLRYK